MRPIKIEETVWVEELGMLHAQKAKEILTKIFFRQNPKAMGLRVECREINLQYEHHHEQGINSRSGSIVITGKVKLQGTFY
jgi:hypothetical protein